jgi:hypothetical protein
VAAFKKPELYSKLLERLAGHPVPTKDGLKNILYRDYKIVESMAPIAADAFLESLKVAGLVTAGNSIAAGDSAVPALDPHEGTGAGERPKPNTKMLVVPDDFIVYKCKISKGRVIDIAPVRL